LTTPPVAAAVRTIYPQLVRPRQVTALFSLDATAQELIWVGGPVISAVVSTQVSTVAGLLVCVAFQLIGGAWFIASPEIGRAGLLPARRRLGAVLRRPTVAVAVAVGLLLVAS